MKFALIRMLILYCLAATLTISVATQSSLSTSLQYGVSNEASSTHGSSELRNGAQIEEVVVESSLFIKSKSNANERRARNLMPATFLNALTMQHRRVQRQLEFRRRQLTPGTNFYGSGSQAATNVEAGPQSATVEVNSSFSRLPIIGNSQSQAASNAAANNKFQKPYEFGSTAAIARGQAFESQGNSGGFGASSASSATQDLAGSLFGFSNAAGASLNQLYKLPNGQTINFVSTNNFANTPFANNANSLGGAVLTMLK